MTSTTEPDESVPLLATRGCAASDTERKNGRSPVRSVLGFLLAIMTSALVAMTAGCVQALERKVPDIELVFGGKVVMIMFTLPFYLFKALRGWPRVVPSCGGCWLLFYSLLCVAVHVFLFTSVHFLPLGTVGCVQRALQFVLVIALSRMFLGEGVGLLKLMAVVMCIAGATLVSQPDFLFKTNIEGKALALSETTTASNSTYLEKEFKDTKWNATDNLPNLTPPMMAQINLTAEKPEESDFTIMPLTLGSIIDLETTKSMTAREGTSDAAVFDTSTYNISESGATTEGLVTRGAGSTLSSDPGVHAGTVPLHVDLLSYSDSVTHSVTPSVTGEVVGMVNQRTDNTSREHPPSKDCGRSGADRQWVGYLVVLGTALSVSTAVIVQKAKLQHISAVDLNFWVAVTGVPLTAGLSFSLETPTVPTELNSFLLFAASLVGNVAVSLMAVQSVRMTSPLLICIGFSMQAVFMLAAQYLFLSQLHPRKCWQLEVGGALLVVLSVVIIGVTQNKRPSAAVTQNTCPSAAVTQNTRPAVVVTHNTRPAAAATQVEM